MPIHMPKKVPDEDRYVIRGFTTATIDGAIIPLVLINAILKARL